MVKCNLIDDILPELHLQKKQFYPQHRRNELNFTSPWRQF